MCFDEGCSLMLMKLVATLARGPPPAGDGEV